MGPWDWVDAPAHRLASVICVDVSLVPLGLRQPAPKVVRQNRLSRQCTASNHAVATDHQAQCHAWVASISSASDTTDRLRDGRKNFPL